MGKRDEIVEQAFEVFYANGFHTSGVAPLLAETGISKRTLYKYFRSKEELIVAVLEHYQRKSFAEIPVELAQRAKTPKGQILALFDLKAELVRRGDFRGCLALKAKLEFDNIHAGIEDACKQFTDDIEGFLSILCSQSGCKEPRQISRQIMILFEGAMVLGQLQRDPAVFGLAKNLAKKLLEAGVKQR